MDAISAATYPSDPRCRRGLQHVIKPFGLSHIILSNQSNESFLTAETFWQPGLECTVLLMTVSEPPGDSQHLRQGTRHNRPPLMKWLTACTPVLCGNLGSSCFVTALPAAPVCD